MCAQGRVEQDEWGVRFHAGEWADSYLQRTAPSPGYSIVIFRGSRHIADPCDLSPTERAGYWSDVCVAARALHRVFSPCHLNYQLLGNAVPHVHTHVIPRYLDDPAPGKPLPTKMWEESLSVSDADLVTQVALLRAACL